MRSRKPPPFCVTRALPRRFGFGWQSWTMIENFSAWHDLQIGTMENGFAGTEHGADDQQPRGHGPHSDDRGCG
jgi:hypothetical protein